MATASPCRRSKTENFFHTVTCSEHDLIVTARKVEGTGEFSELLEISTSIMCLVYYSFSFSYAEGIS
jgi:hypothetical protein